MTKAYSYQRFSDPRQARGSSLERQLSAAKDYAKDKGLELDTSLRPDEGLSGFTGKNRDKGSLGEFLRMIREGRVARGSYLLVDSMDRLSRLKPTEAAHQLLGVALAGVKVATLNDGAVFDEDADISAMITAVLKMAGAHDYSKELGRTVAKGHATAKRKAREEGRIYTKTGPGWLELSADRTHWIKRLDRVDQVQRIFDMADEQAMGSRVIAHHMLAEKPFRHGERWHQVTVLKLLKNRMVLGEYQPRFRDGSPDGETIPGYYGEGIIDPAQFARVNRRLALTGVKLGRRSSPQVLNDMLQGLGRCGLCGGTAGVHIRSKDRRVLYHCNEAGGRGCGNTVRFRRDEIEATLLRVIAEADLTPPRQRDESVLAVETAQAERADLASKVERLLDMLEDGDATMRERYRQRVADLAAKDTEIAKLRTGSDQARSLHPPTKHQSTLREYAEQMTGLRGKALYEARTRASAALKAVIDDVVFDPDGFVDFILLGGFKAYRIDREGGFIGEARVGRSYLSGVVVLVVVVGVYAQDDPERRRMILAS